MLKYNALLIEEVVCQQQIKQAPQTYALQIHYGIGIRTVLSYFDFFFFLSFHYMYILTLFTCCIQQYEVEMNT